MTALVLEPHQDDAALFSAFNAIRHRAHIVCVTASTTRREEESRRAAFELGCTFEQWAEPFTEPDWPDIRRDLEHYDQEHNPELVFAPASTRGGNEQHNTVSVIAGEVFGARVTHLHPFWVGRNGMDDTYRRGLKTSSQDHRIYLRRSRMWAPGRSRV